MSVRTHRVPIADGLFTWPSDEPQLLGSRCRACGTITFPVQHGCPRCNADDPERIALARRGTLWSWTTQGFLPKHPYAGAETAETFEPYTLGYVELPGQVRVEGRLTERDPSRLAIGMEMEMVVVPFRTDEDGNEVVTYAFAPVTGDGHE